MKEIYLAGGCFWGVQGYFDQLAGIKATQVGYANGRMKETNYHILSLTDHAETLHLSYDPAIISLQEILKHYFRIIDPFSVNKQGNDYGRQYRTGIYFVNQDDEATIMAEVQAVSQANSGRRVAVEVEPLNHFILAEEYHQDYLKKNPNGYCHIDLSLAKKPLD